jgi:tRNA threonylcarbamoyl adenosine modification protein (Sua5/YciO/YrdC/YwlC family)
VTPSPPAGVDEAVAALLAGLVVVLPTDTVYGVATAISVPGSSAALFAVKERPTTVALPVLCADEASARSLAGALPPGAEALMARCWPGPLTVVVPRRPGLSLDLGGTDDTTVGLRVPDAEVVRTIAARTGPLACTSANRHGAPTPETAAAAAAELGPGVAAVVDGGRLSGAPSTVVGWVDDELRILRHGALPVAVLEDVLRQG